MHEMGLVLKKIYFDSRDHNNIATHYQDLMNPLAIPKGQAPNLPSIRVEDGQLDTNVEDMVEKETYNI